MRRPVVVAWGLALFLLGAGAGALILHGTEHGSHPEASDQSPSAADIGFSQDMVVHHDQAVEMSRLVRGRVDGQVAALAESILEVQSREVGVMRGWLELWDAPQVSDDVPMAWMDPEHAGHGSGSHASSSEDADDHGTEDEPPMPGMASQEQLGALESLSGRELEVHFLQLMFAHHEGGIEMAEHGRRSASLDAVSAFARSMSLEQEQEQNLMLQLLAERDAEPLADPAD